MHGRQARCFPVCDIVQLTAWLFAGPGSSQHSCSLSVARRMSAYLSRQACPDMRPPSEPIAQKSPGMLSHSGTDSHSSAVPPALTRRHFHQNASSPYPLLRLTRVHVLPYASVCRTDLPSGRQNFQIISSRVFPQPAFTSSALSR